MLSFECDREAAVHEISNEVKEVYPDYDVCIQPDVDITE